uniref:Uncharacterized protein n=1 Tax=viral metagenome TaxID=1070528 RepID=A0A6C0K5M2_9ZZZZ
MDSNVSDDPGLQLGDISDYTKIDDFGVISVAGTFMSFLVLLSARIANFGGVPLNTYFDMFGMEGILSMVLLILILFQITRYFYTVFYEKSGKSWSPFVFICFLLGVHLVHDLALYYAVISQIPKGKNDMIDIVRSLTASNQAYTLFTHSAFLIITALVAMIVEDMSDLAKIAVFGVVVYLMPVVLAIHQPKPAPPPQPPKKPEMQDMRGNYYS